MNELIRKYLGYPELRKGQDYDWDGRDMVEAINKMVEAAGVEPASTPLFYYVFLYAFF